MTSTRASGPAADQPDEDMAVVLRRIAELRVGQADRYALPMPAARDQLLAERRWWIDGAPTMADSVEWLLPAHRGEVRLRRHVPKAERPGTGARADRAPAEIVYLHGGGWCVGSIDTHDGVMRWLADACGLPVTGIDYPLAPEHPYPAAADAVTEALRQLRARARPDTRWILAGDSAGANLSLGEAVRARDAGEPMPDALLLFYGIYYALRDSASMQQFGDGRFGLSRQVLERYDVAYFGRPVDTAPPPATDPARVSAPGRADGLDLRGLPPAWLAAAGLDPLRDDSIDLAAALSAAGSASTLRFYPATVHGFLSYARLLRTARTAFRDAAAFVGRILDDD